MPFLYPHRSQKNQKEFTFKECEDLGLKKWQSPLFQFILVAFVLLVLMVIIASKYALNVETSLAISFVFAALMIISAYIIVRRYNKIIVSKHKIR